MQKYIDNNGIEYQIGDIVLNAQGIGDFWVVQQCNNEEKKRYGLETDICLALNNSKDDYAIDIDEPVGFEIVIRPDNEHYQDAIKELDRIAELRRRWLDGEEDGSITENK